jgi:hypothetical protein
MWLERGGKRDFFIILWRSVSWLQWGYILLIQKTKIPTVQILKNKWNLHMWLFRTVDESWYPMFINMKHFKNINLRIIKVRQTTFVS